MVVDPGSELTRSSKLPARRASSSTFQSLLKEEFSARSKSITRNAIVYRLFFIFMIFVMASPEFVSDLYSAAFAITSIGLGIFWLGEETTSAQSARSLILLIQEFYEGRISRKDDEEIIRWQYAKMNDFYGRIQLYFRVIEPVFWMFASFSMIIFRMHGGHFFERGTP